MRKLNQWMKLAPVVALAIAASACADQSPTEVQSPLEAGQAPSFATSATGTVAKVSVFPGRYTLDVGQVKQMVALPKDASGNTLSTATNPIIWSSSNPEVATVGANGRVVALSGGLTYIKATYKGVTGKSPITVRAPITASTIAISASATKVEVGTYAQLTATAKSSRGDPVSVPLTWSSSSSAVKVYANGLIQAVSTGTATIKVSGGGVSATIAISSSTEAAPPTEDTAEPGSNVAKVLVFPNTQTLAIGQGKLMIALPRDASGTTLSGKTVTWKSSDTSVATISSTGMLITRSAGVVRITATVEGTVGTATITVTS